MKKYNNKNELKEYLLSEEKKPLKDGILVI